MVDFGTDIDSSWSVTPQGDFKLISDTENAGQAIKNRLLTRYDELSSLGYEEYGSHTNEVIGMTNQDLAIENIRLYTEEALDKEPRVEEIVNINISFDGRLLTLDLTVKLIDEDNTENIILTTELEGA